MAPNLPNQYPWTSSPIIINAPMGSFAGDALAVAVSQAGGIGMIGAVSDMKLLRQQLQRARQVFSHSPTLPLGVGFLPFISNRDEAIPLVAEFHPAIVWLFAAKEFSDYATWAHQIRSVSPTTKLWIQVGNVNAALTVLKLCQPDVLVLQGSDAGGHGFERGSSIVSFLPEATDVLHANGYGHVPLVASGGVVDGRGVAAALTLGAHGVVMGTRFLAAPETTIHPKYQQAILAAHDGGLSTARSKLFDQLRGPNMWPLPYDGRALITQSYRDYQDGVDLQTIQDRHAEAVSDEDAGFGEKNPRAAVWVGAGVGLVNDVKPAGEIVKNIREEAKRVLDRFKESHYT